MNAKTTAAVFDTKKSPPRQMSASSRFYLNVLRERCQVLREID